MANFVYRVIKNERRISGVISASNVEIAKELLIKCGCEVLYVKRQLLDFQFAKKLTSKELINFFSSMASMDKVGIDVLHSLEIMKDDVAITRNLKQVCEKVYFSVAGGMSLSEACHKASGSFTHDFIGLIKIAEETGNYSKVFEQIVSYIKWSFEINERSKRLVRGPMMTIGMVIAMIIGMSTFMLPKMIEFIEHFNFDPPAYTLALISFANFIKANWNYILLCCIFVYVIVKSFSYISEDFACKVDMIKLKLPIFGELFVKLDTSRFISFFSLMYNSGSDIIDMLDSISKIVANRYFAKRIIRVKQQILDGSTIFEAINKEKVFPKMFRKMIAICETTGEVGPVLNNVKYFYDQETQETTDKIVGMIKPMTLIVLGGMIAWMGSAMLGPIYMNIGNLGELTNVNAGY